MPPEDKSYFIPADAYILFGRSQLLTAREKSGPVPSIAQGRLHTA